MEAIIPVPKTAPIPCPAINNPMSSGPTLRTSLAITGIIWMYGNASIFIITVISTTARIGLFPKTYLNPSYTFRSTGPSEEVRVFVCGSFVDHIINAAIAWNIAIHKYPPVTDTIAIRTPPRIGPAILLAFIDPASSAIPFVIPELPSRSKIRDRLAGNSKAQMDPVTSAAKYVCQ